jgi:predicted dehydrogenase
MTRPIGVGVIGCGEVAQIIHLPPLHELRDLFSVTALCGVSASVLAGIGAMHQGARLYADYRQLVADPAVDAVPVGNPDAYHAQTVIAAVAAGKHVLLEKPIAVTIPDADAMIAAEAKAKTKVTVQVGYMRRYAPAHARNDMVLARDIAARME